MLSPMLTLPHLVLLTMLTPPEPVLPTVSNLPCRRANKIGGCPSFTYRSIDNAQPTRALQKMIALLKEGVPDEEWDPAFHSMYTKMVDYSEDPEPVKWPIPPVDKDVMEQCIADLLIAEGPEATEPSCAFGKDYDAVVAILKELSWNDEIDPPMFDLPKVMHRSMHVAKTAEGRRRGERRDGGCESGDMGGRRVAGAGHGKRLGWLVMVAVGGEERWRGGESGGGSAMGRGDTSQRS